MSTDALKNAVVEAAEWHEAADKALSKQPPSSINRWRRAEHQEQASKLRAALDAAQCRPPEAETVRLGLMRSRTRADYMACAAPEQGDPAYWVRVGNITLVLPVAPPIPTIPGTVTLPLDVEPER